MRERSLDSRHLPDDRSLGSVAQNVRHVDALEFHRQLELDATPEVVLLVIYEFPHFNPAAVYCALSRDILQIFAFHFLQLLVFFAFDLFKLFDIGIAWFSFLLHLALIKVLIQLELDLCQIKIVIGIVCLDGVSFLLIAVGLVVVFLIGLSGFLLLVSCISIVTLNDKVKF